MRALSVFQAPVDAHGVTAEDFTVPGAVYQIGLPPRRIDVLTEISGVDFDTAWEGHTESKDSRLPFLGREELLANKRAAGRAKDLLDVQALEAQKP